MALDSDKLAHFKSIGPAGVKHEMAEGKHGQAPDSRLWIEASTWVESESIRLSLESEARRDTHEERTLAIAEEANGIAASALSSSRRANVIAITAAIFATAATIIAAIIGVMWASTK